MIWVILIIAVLIAGIVLLSGPSFKQKTREEFLKDLAHFLEGRLEAVKDQPECLRVRFTFAGESFFFEDVPEKGLQQDTYKAYLKVPIKSRLTFYFIEKRPVTTMKSEVIIVSQIPDEPLPQEIKVPVPQKLKGLEVYTNDPRTANELLKDGKVVSVFSEFKNVDSRGYFSVPVRIMDGLVALEFSASVARNPSRHNLLNSISSIDDYVEKLLKIVKVLKEIEQGSQPQPPDYPLE